MQHRGASLVIQAFLKAEAKRHCSCNGIRGIFEDYRPVYSPRMRLADAVLAHVSYPDKPQETSTCPGLFNLKEISTFQ